MKNFTLARLAELIEYLAEREEFLCQPTHTCLYLKSWSEHYDYNENFQDILMQQFNIHCDCQALAIGKKRLVKKSHGPPKE